MAWTCRSKVNKSLSPIPHQLHHQVYIDLSQKLHLKLRSLGAMGFGWDRLKSPVLCLSHIKARKMGNALLMCTKKSSKSHSGYQQHALLEIDANAGRQSDTLLNPCRQKPLDMLHNPPYSMLQIRVWLLYRRPNCHIHQIPSSDIKCACCRCNNSMVSYKLHGFM